MNLRDGEMLLHEGWTVRRSDSGEVVLTHYDMVACEARQSVAFTQEQWSKILAHVGGDVTVASRRTRRTSDSVVG